jgi:general stress protein 26
VIGRLWNRSAAVWFEHGKRDPALTLLRFKTERAEIWNDASSLFRMARMLFGADPKKEYKNIFAQVELR